MGILALLATNVLDQFPPMLLKWAVDCLGEGLRGLRTLSQATERATLLAGLILGVSMLQGGLRYGWRMGFFGVGRFVEYAMRRQLFVKLLSLPAAYYLKNRLGDLLSRAMSDLATVRESLGFGWLSFMDSISSVT